MVGFFERAIQPLVRLGVIELLMFFLVMVIIYVFLQRSRVLGKSSNRTKNYSVIISLCCGLMFVNLVPSSIFIEYFAWTMIFFVAGLGITLLLAFTNIDQDAQKYAFYGLFGIAFLFLIAQFVKSQQIMTLVLAIAALVAIIVGFLGLNASIFFGSIGLNVVLVVMAYSLGMQKAVEDVYLSGITIGMFFFALIMWWIMGGEEKFFAEARREKGRDKVKEKESGKTKDDRKAKKKKDKELSPKEKRNMFRKKGYGIEKVAEIDESEIDLSKEGDIYYTKS
jgi:hypothetical protein